MGMIPTLLNIYARNQRFHHNRRSQEQERNAANKRAAEKLEQENLAPELEAAKELERQQAKPATLRQSAASPLTKFRRIFR